MAETYLVTGGAGFIGSHVAKLLAQRGDEVIVVDDFNSGLYSSTLKRDRVKNMLQPFSIPVYEVDIRKKRRLNDLFKGHNISKICHLAAWAGVQMSLKKPEIYESVNITGTRHIFELALAHNIPHIVYASSSSVYGANTSLPFRESDRVDQPIAPYALSKRINELQAFYFHHLYHIKSTGLRFFTVYGPWGRPDMALFIFTEKILKGDPISVNNHGKMKRDFTYIDDIADGVLAALDRPMEYEIFNLGGDQTVQLTHFIDVIEKTIGKKAQRHLLPMQPGDVPETSADVSNARNLLGFEPKVHINEGIPLFWAWYKDYYHV
jgi:UDP-glucuronate 4-epimerase